MTEDKQLEIGDEVELLTGFDHLYNPDPFGDLKGVFVGCHGYVRDLRDDPDGFPQAFIEWKKDDWRYAGLSDGWTFSGHFKTVLSDAKEDPKQDNADEIVKEMISLAEQRVEEEDERADDACEHCGEVHSHDFDRAADFIEGLIKAEREISLSEGYLVLTIRREPEQDYGERKAYISYPIVRALSVDAERALEEQILQLASKVIMERMRRRELGR